MKNKKYYFLGGLMRSGNTLISSILNQNPDIKVSPNSIVPDLYESLDNLKSRPNFDLHDSNLDLIDNFLKKSMDIFYENVDCKYLIDRNGAWGTPENLEKIKKYVTEDVKIIFPVRNITDILSSFVRSLKSHPDNIITQEAFEHTYPYLSDEDRICDYLMSTGSPMLDLQLYSLKNLLKEENRKYLHIIEYEDLVSNPKKQIRKIYDFLEIPYYDHDFKNICQYSFENKSYNDIESLGVPLHSINTGIVRKRSPRSKTVLSKYAYQKYSNLEFWR